MKIRYFLNSLLVFGIVLCGNFVSFRGQDVPTSRMVISYDDEVQGSEAEQWHLEDFREVLLKEPDANTYIIAYNGRDDNPGKARRYALRGKNYLAEFRGIDPQRIIVIEGGRREDFIVELWVVPKGAIAPVPTSTVTNQNDLGDNLLYDTFGVGYDNFGKYESADAHLAGFATALKKEPSSWGCVAVYAQNGDDQVGMDWDSPGTALEMAQGQKTYLVKEYGFAPSRITAVDGGYSEGRTIELWVMRPKARFDRGPRIYPNRLIVRDNKTLTITGRDNLNDCCKACAREQLSARTKNGRRTKRR